MQSIKKLGKNEYFVLSVLIILTSLVLFYKFIIGGSVFAYTYNDIARDTMDQYIPVFEYYTRGISLYDFSYGMGTSIFASLNWVTEPLPALMILAGRIFGETCIPYLVVFMQIFKMVIGGIFCYKFLRLFKFSKFSSMFSAYIFAFCGAIIIAGQHYQFATVAIYFLIILYFIEKTIIKKINFIFLVIVVFLSSLLSPGFVFFMLLSSGVYAVARVIQLKDSVREILKEILILAGSMILGLLMAMFVFLPSLNEIINVSSRVGSTPLFERIIGSFQLLSFEEIKTAFLRLFSGNLQGGTNSWSTNSPYLSVHFSAISYCFTPILVLSLVQYIRETIKGIKVFKKQMVVRIIIFVLMLSPFFIAFIPDLSNLFANIDYRFVYIYEPLFAIVVANFIQKICENKFSRILNIVTLCVSIIFVSVLFTFESSISKIAFVVAIFSMMAVVFIIELISRGYLKRYGYKFLFVVVALGLLADNGISTYAGRHSLSTTELNNYQGGEFSELVEYVKDSEGSNFYRLDRTFEDTVPGFMMSLIIPTRSASIYNGVMNGNLSTYLSKFHNTNSYSQVLYSGSSYGTVFDTVTATTLGLKYVISQSERNLPDWSLVKEQNGYYIYENKTMDSAALFYNKYIYESDFDNLSNIEKKFVLSQAVVVPDNTENINGEQIKNIEYNTISTSLEGKYIDNDYVIPIDNTQINEENQQNLLKFNVVLGKDTKIKVGINTKSGIIPCGDYYWDGNNIINSDNQEVLINIPSDATGVVISTQNQDINISDICIFTSKAVYSNNNIHIENPDMNGRLIGTVENEKDSILYLPVVYEKGWSAYVNGSEVPIIKSDYGFSSINIEKGSSNIELVYSNDYFKTGITLTIISLIIFVCIIFIYIIRKRKVGN